MLRGPRSFIANLSLAGSLSLAGIALAGTNEGAAVCTIRNAQQFPVTVSDGSGGAIIAWKDRRNGGWDIYAQHSLASGAVDPGWPAGGLAVCTAQGDQINAVIVPDGSGGAIVAWQDGRAFGADDIYAQRVLAGGVVDPSWPSGGRAVATAPNVQEVPAAVSDGSGGAIIVWQDQQSSINNRVLAQHVLVGGALDAAWPVGGRAVAAPNGQQLSPALTTDGAGGALIAWADTRSGSPGTYAQHVKSNGSVDSAWPPNGVQVGTAPGGQSAPKIVSDAAGGAVIAWEDGVDVRVFANHVVASGSVDPIWPVNGLAVCVGPGQQSESVLTGDGAGGAIIAWRDTRNDAGDTYAQHVLPNGTIDGSWPATGRPICSFVGLQSSAVIASDGSGGAFVTWQDSRNVLSSDLFAQHVLASGAIAPGWPDGGLTICDAAAEQDVPTIAPDGTGGAIVAWMDNRRDATNEGAFDIYAQRVTGDGAYLFQDSEVPVVVSVRDVPGDQGGKVKLSWTASGPDKDGSGVVEEYWVWRSVPPNAIESATSGAAIPVLERGPRPSRGAVYTSESPLLAGYYWELFATQRAGTLAGYSMVCRTEMDSLASGNPFTVFFVQARNLVGTFVRNSAPDSGYSVDNLSPPAPAPLTVVYGDGSNALHWQARTVPDLLEYRLYRGTADTFQPSPTNLIAATAETSFVDSPGGFFYKLAAFDVHGNRSRFLSAAPDRPVATLASFLKAERTSGRLRITWFSGGNSGLAATVYRRAEDTDWEKLGAVVADGTGYLTFNDGSVEDRLRYEYRLGILEPGGEEILLGDTWVEPFAVAFAITGRIVNPSIGGRVSLTVSLPPLKSADVQLFDVTGREVEAIRLAGGNGGDQTIGFGSEQRLRPGVYMVSVASGGASLRRRVVVLD